MATGFSKLRLPDGFDRDMRLLTLSMSSRRISMGFLQVVRAIYFALLGFTPVEIGLLLSLATFVSALHHITFGWLSDRFGRKVFLVLGGIFATMRMVIFALSHDFWMLALGQGIGAMGEGAGAGQPVVSGYISDKVGVVNRASVFSTLAITSALAATVGSLLAGLPAYFQKSLGFDMIAAHSLLFWIGAIVFIELYIRPPRCFWHLILQSRLIGFFNSLFLPYPQRFFWSSWFQGSLFLIHTNVIYESH